MAMEEDAGRGYCYARRESTLKHGLCESSFFTHPPIGTPRRAILAQARAFRFSPLCPKGSSQTVLHCAHRGRTF